jgi:glycosyltransferase involved in cell wall biosynthesis
VSATPTSSADVAVVIPCYNEVSTVGKVVADFKRALPSATVYVFDNNSTDGTAEAARAAGAVVIKEKRQGKGEVLKAVYERVVAEYYVLVDGDDTYPAEMAPALLQPLLEERADVVVGSRTSAYAEAGPRPFHQFGNRLVCLLVNRIFGAGLTDVMSGYRAVSRQVAACLPILSIGFDVETEMTIQLLHRRYVTLEVPIAYRDRPANSASKLRTVSDGLKVLLKILTLLVAYKPLTFFGVLAAGSLTAGLGTGVYAIHPGLAGGPTDVALIVLSTGFLLAAVLLLSLGLTISSINWRVFELESHLTRLVRGSLS